MKLYNYINCKKFILGDTNIYVCILYKSYINQYQVRCEPSLSTLYYYQLRLQSPILKD
jgi:hypothetical protein